MSRSVTKFSTRTLEKGFYPLFRIDWFEVTSLPPVPVVSVQGDAGDDDDDDDHAADHGDDDDAERGLARHVVHSHRHHLDVAGHLVVDDDEDVVGVAVAQVPDDRELALTLQQGRLLTRLIA